MARSNNTERLRARRAQAGIDRAEYFERPGATAADWRGGKHMVQTDRRKEADRKACRNFETE